MTATIQSVGLPQSTGGMSAITMFSSGSGGAPAPAVNTDFVTTWETTTASETITLPVWFNGQNPNFNVDWGDGNNDIITDPTQAEKTHTYALAGTHTITIDGFLPTWGFIFGSSIDNSKIKTIENWGVIGLIHLWNGFYKCSNLISNATDGAGMSTVTTMNSMFLEATSFTGDLSAWDTSAVTIMGSMFRLATSFNGDLSAWNVSAVTSIGAMFLDATSFNGDLSAWDTSAVTSMGLTFRGSSFTGDLSAWDTSAVTSMLEMLKGLTGFDHDLGSWDISNVTNFSGMLSGATLSTANYDSLLTGWGAQIVSPNESFHGGNSTYTLGSPAETSRTSLINDDGWTITDGGGV